MLVVNGFLIVTNKNRFYLYLALKSRLIEIIEYLPILLHKFKTAYFDSFQNYRVFEYSNIRIF